MTIVFFPFPKTQTTRGIEVPGLSTFSFEYEKDESKEYELEDKDPEEEDKVAPGARGPRIGASSEVFFSDAFQFTITDEKSNLN
jgi:hypothetical protein